jgi:hypothetical protein
MEWEFLRRDEQYRKDWEHYTALDHPFKLALTADPHDRKLLLPFYPEEYRDRWDDVWKMAKKYGLLRLPDPSIKVPRLLAFFQIPQDLIQVVIDRKRPIKPQLAAYSKILTTQQKHRHGYISRDPRLNRSQWATYLRVLDARSVGISFNDIGRDLLEYDHSQTGIHAREVFMAAKRVWSQIYLGPSSLPELLDFISDEESFPDPIHPELKRRTLSII